MNVLLKNIINPLFINKDTRKRYNKIKNIRVFIFEFFAS